MGLIRGFIRDVLIVYICYQLIKVWLFNAPFTRGLGTLVVILLLSAIWFMLERVGIMPKVI